MKEPAILSLADLFGPVRREAADATWAMRLGRMSQDDLFQALGHPWVERRRMVRCEIERREMLAR